MIRLFVSLVLVGFFAGCANGPPVSALSTPAAVQTDITVIGSLAVSRVSASAKAAIHGVAVQLAAGAVDPTSVQSDLQKLSIPAKDQALVNGVVDAGVVVVNLAIAKWGSHNTLTIQYVQAVGNGLIQAGF